MCQPGRSSGAVSSAHKSHETRDILTMLWCQQAANHPAYRPMDARIFMISFAQRVRCWSNATLHEVHGQSMAAAHKVRSRVPILNAGTIDRVTTCIVSENGMMSLQGDG